MDYIGLIGSVGEDQENDPADVQSTAASLTTLGIGRMDRAVQTGVCDGDFDGGVHHYQASNELDVDGILLPGGPTQQSINAALEYSDDVIEATKPEDFDDPSIYFDALETLLEDAEGAEPAGFRDDLRKLLEAMRRRPGVVPKAPPGPPRPPIGQPPLPKEIAERLDYIKDPQARLAANRLLDGAVVKGWTPKTVVSPEPAEVIKSGGVREAMKDFGQFVGRSGGTKDDIKGLPGGKGYQFTTADKDTTIVMRRTQEGGKITNELQIWLPDPAPGAPRQGRGAKLLIKIRYE